MLKINYKNFFFAVVAVFSLTVCSGCFIVKQGYYVLKYATQAQRIEKVRQRSDVSDEDKAFLSLVEEIRLFAVDSLGLSKNRNFTKYIVLNKNHIADVVYAAGKLDFTPYTWRFPIVGSFQNKGFFERKDAQKQADALSEKGYDVCILPATAFSMLGFVPDPVYSYMKRYSPFSLAFLIFHEQTHATLFIKNQLQFNEELATFIGNEGGLRFIRGRYGDTSEYFKNALDMVHDEDVYTGLMRTLKDRLKAVYDSVGIDDENKLFLKKKTISDFKDSVNAQYDSLFCSQNFRGLSKIDINNARISAQMTYTLNLSLFRDFYDKKNHDIRAMLKSLKTLKRAKGDPHASMVKLE
jgi:predicted aminopeptidase